MHQATAKLQLANLQLEKNSNVKILEDYSLRVFYNQM